MSSGQSGGSPSKHPDDYWYDKLGPKVRKALQESVTTWSSRWCYKMTQEHGAGYVVAQIQAADVGFIKKGWRMKHFEKNVISSYFDAKVKPLRANW